jgi:hypothetical protein
VSGNLVPAGSTDWFSITFAAGGHPHVTLTGNPGGHSLNVFSSCGTPVGCQDIGGTNVTDWEFYDTPPPPPHLDAPRLVAAPTQVIVQVTTTAAATCANYTVSISN